MDLGFISLNTPRDIPAGRLASELEARGFESLWVGEHPQIPVSAADQFHPALLDAQRQILDPMISLAAAAQATTRLRIGTAVALPLEREVFTFAKEVATLDQMSDGRLLLGVGVGMRAELEVARTIGWADRYRALGDMVAALKALWGTEVSEHHGEFFDFPPVWSFPKPRQKPHPPLLAASTGPKAISQCLRWSDGWIPGDAAYQDLPKAVAEFRSAAAEAGRDPAALDMTIMVWREPTLELLAGYRDLGFTRAVVGGSRRDPHDHASTLSFLDRCAEIAALL